MAKINKGKKMAKSKSSSRASKTTKKSSPKLPRLFGGQFSKPTIFVIAFALVGLGTLLYSLAAVPTGQIKSKASGKCLENFFGRQEDGNFITAYPCDSGNASQKWSFYSGDKSIRTAQNYCLDVQKGGKTPGTKVHLWRCTGGVPQKWDVLSNGLLRNPNSMLCLEASAGNSFLGGPTMSVNTCNAANTRQVWTVPSTALPTPIPTPPPTNPPAPTNPTPAPGGRPGATNTGPRNSRGVVMTAAEKGALPRMSDVQVENAIRSGQRTFSNVYITGEVTIPTGVTGTVTFRNFVVNGNWATYGIRNCYSGAGCMTLVAEDGEILNVGASAGTGGAMVAANYTARRLNVHDSGGDGFKILGSNVLIENSWWHHLGLEKEAQCTFSKPAYVAGGCAHADGAQSQGGGYKNLIIRGNYCDLEETAVPIAGKPGYYSAGYHSNACYIKTDGTVNIVIENNWLKSKNRIIQDCAPGVVVRNNIISRYRNKSSASSLRDALGGACTWSGNRFEDGAIAP